MNKELLLEVIEKKGYYKIDRFFLDDTRKIADELIRDGIEIYDHQVNYNTFVFTKELFFNTKKLK